jgi:hypothetical protein
MLGSDDDEVQQHSLILKSIRKATLPVRPRVGIDNISHDMMSWYAKPSKT